MRVRQRSMQTSSKHRTLAFVIFNLCHTLLGVPSDRGSGRTLRCGMAWPVAATVSMAQRQSSCRSYDLLKACTSTKPCKGDQLPTLGPLPPAKQPACSWSGCTQTPPPLAAPALVHSPAPRRSPRCLAAAPPAPCPPPVAAAEAPARPAGRAAAPWSADGRAWGVGSRHAAHALARSCGRLAPGSVRAAAMLLCCHAQA